MSITEPKARENLMDSGNAEESCGGQCACSSEANAEEAAANPTS